MDRYTLPAVDALEPLQQGSLDSLCGLYSIINGIRLVLHPDRVLSDEEQSQLFRSGLGFYRQDRNLAKLLNWGMSEKAWFELSAKMLAFTTWFTGITLRQTLLLDGMAPRQRMKTFQAIRRELRRDSPILVALRGQHNHYSVIVGYRPTRFILFDSTALRWVRIHSLGLQSRGGEHRHILTKHGVVAYYRP